MPKIAIFPYLGHKSVQFSFFPGSCYFSLQAKESDYALVTPTVQLLEMDSRFYLVVTFDTTSSPPRTSHLCMIPHSTIPSPFFPSYIYQPLLVSSPHPFTRLPPALTLAHPRCTSLTSALRCSLCVFIVFGVLPDTRPDYINKHPI